MTFEFGPRDDPQKYRLIQGDGLYRSRDMKNCGLKSTALKVLALLVKARGRKVSAEAIVESLGVPSDPRWFAHTYVRQIRRALDPSERMEAVKTERGIGFWFNWPQQKVEPQIEQAEALKHGTAVALLQRRLDPFISKSIKILEGLPHPFPGKFEALSMAHLHLAGYVSGERQDVELAVERASEAVTLWPNSWHAYAALGLAQSCVFEWANADASFQQALRLDSVATNQSIEFGIYRVSKGELDSVFEAWNGILGNHPPLHVDHFLRQSMLQIHYMKNDFSACRISIEENSEAMASSWIPFSIRALLAMDEGKTDEAIEWFNRACTGSVQR